MLVKPIMSPTRTCMVSRSFGDIAKPVFRVWESSSVVLTNHTFPPRSNLKIVSRSSMKLNPVTMPHKITSITSLSLNSKRPRAIRSREINTKFR